MTTPTASSLALAREILNTPHLNGGYNTEVKRVATLIDRHCAEKDVQVEHYRWHADNFARILQKLGSYAGEWRKPYLVSEIERFKQDVALPYLHDEEKSLSS